MHTLHFCTLPTVQECKECTGVIPEFEMMKSMFFLVYHYTHYSGLPPCDPYPGAVPSVLPRTEITAMREIP